MAGHNKWSKIKHIKAVADVRKGKEFSKVARMIMQAARQGGGDPAGRSCGSRRLATGPSW